jgi:hypothetical protein
MISHFIAKAGLSERTANQVRLALLAVAGAMLFGATAAADSTVALLERVNDKSIMEYVQAGQIIRLGPQDTIVLRYLSSCLRETITGGTVRVGPDWSEVQSGEVQRFREECGAGKMVLTGTQSPIAGRAFRGLGH